MTTGSLRTLRLSATGGRTFMSMIAAADGGAGSVNRIYGYYKSKNATTAGFYKTVFGIRRGQFANRINQYLNRY
jgi:hypothetical protein